MKIQIDANDLRDIASFSMNSVNSRPTSPIMAGLLIEAKESTVTITGDDYNSRSTAHSPADVQEPGKTLVNGPLLTSIIGKLKAQKPVMLNTEDRLMKISQGAKVFSIPTMDPAEYPTFKVALRELGTVNGEALAHGVKSVFPAVSKDLSLDILTGINMILGPEIGLQSTDRYRIADAVIDWDSSGEETHALVPAKWLHGATKYADGEVTISVEENNGQPSRIAISCGPYETVSGIMAGDFPRLKSLTDIDTSHWRATFNREELLEAIDSVAMMAERNTPVRIALKNGVATIDAGSSDGGVGIAQISVEHAEDVVMAFQPQFIMDGLKSHDAEEITLNINNPNKPVVITGTERLKYTAMPVRLPAANTN